jgi:hypothetical protein
VRNIRALSQSALVQPGDRIIVAERRVDAAPVNVVVFRRPQPTAPAAPAPSGYDLFDRLRRAIDDAPIIAPSTSLTWRGTVVELVGYRGRDAPIAKAGAQQGHTLGLLVDDEGLLCLTASEQDGAPYGRLRESLGRRVEIVGVLAGGTDLPVVQVIASSSP